MCMSVFLCVCVCEYQCILVLIYLYVCLSIYTHMLCWYVCNCTYNSVCICISVFLWTSLLKHFYVPRICMLLFSAESGGWIVISWDSFSLTFFPPFTILMTYIWDILLWCNMFATLWLSYFTLPSYWSDFLNLLSRSLTSSGPLLPVLELCVRFPLQLLYFSVQILPFGLF